MAKTVTRYHRMLLLLALCVSVAGAGEPPASSEIQSERITCALIADGALGFDQSPTFALLEASLTQHPRLALVERTQIARIIEEELLQRAFGAEGGDERQRLGGLLKARMLVIVRASERKLGDQQQSVRLLHVMIADTGNGLRILTTDHFWDDKQPQPTVESIRQDVDRALTKLVTPIRAVVTVPPFVCEDFTFGYSLLKGAYAELLIQPLDRVPGIQTVEIAEARAIAAERGLAGDEALRRPLLPYFVEGSYRNTGEDEERRVHVSVRLQRDGQSLSETTADDLQPTSVPAFLQDVARAFVQEMLQIEPPSFDAEREVELIEKRIGELERLGDYEEGLRLIEVAALIKPDSSVHERAVNLAAKLANQLHNPYIPEDFATRARKAVDASFTALDNLKRLAGRPDFDPLQSRGLIERGCGCGLNMFQLIELAQRKDFAQAMGDLAWGRRELIISYIERLDADGKLVTSATVWSCNRLITIADYPLPAARDVFGAQESRAKYLDDTYRLIRVLYKHPVSGGFTNWWCQTLLRGKVSNSPEFHDLLDRVAALPGRRSKVIAACLRLIATTNDSTERARELSSLIAYVRDSGIAAEDLGLLRFLESEMTTIPGYKRPDSSARRKGAFGDEPTPAGRLRFTKIDQFEQAFEQYLAKSDPMFEYYRKQYPDKKLTYGMVSSLRGCIRARDGTDIFWTGEYPQGDRILAMRPMGGVEGLYETQGGRFYSVIYDGRYVWVNEGSRLTVVDPDSGQAEAITSADGLLPGEMVIAPVVPGCICAVGYFGRTWCALARYDGPGRRSLEVIHEAALAQGNPDDPHVAFKPAIAVTLPESSASTRPYVLVVKDPQPIAGNVSFNPLLIDPIAKTVKVLPFPVKVYFGPMTSAIHDGAFYWLELIGQRDLQLWKLAGPEWEKRLIMKRVPNSVTGMIPPTLAFVGDRCLLAGPKVWLVDLETGGLAPVESEEYRGKSPHLERASFVPTHHNGLIVLPAFGEIYRAEFEVATSQPAPAMKPPLSQPTEARAQEGQKPKTSPLDLAAGTKPGDKATSPLVVPPLVAAEFARAERFLEREALGLRVPPTVPPAKDATAEPRASASGKSPSQPPKDGTPVEKASPFGGSFPPTAPPGALPHVTMVGPYGPRPVIFETVGETLCEGRVLDRETGKPLAGALVFPSQIPPPLQALCFTDQQWAKLRGLSLDQLRRIGSGKADPELQSLSPLRAFLLFSSVGRTDSDGRYRVSVKAHDASSQLVAIAEHYIPAHSTIGDTGPSGDGKMDMTDMYLSPSAIVTFRAVAARRIKLQLYLIGERQGFMSYGPAYLLAAKPPSGVLPISFPPTPMMAPPPFVQSREDGRVVATEASAVWANEVCRFPVPAGLQMTIELRGHQHATDPSDSVRPVVLADRIVLKPGEVLDVGEVRMQSDGPPPDDRNK